MPSTEREIDGRGLYYYRARYYNPQTGRFISEDPLGYDGSGPNLYKYAYDSPTDVIDPTGNCPFCIIAGIGAGLGGITEGFNGYRCGHRGWKLAGDIIGGAAAGGFGALAGTWVTVTTGNPYLAGAAGSAVYDAVNMGTQTSTWTNFTGDKALDIIGDVEMGIAFGKVGDMLGPAVRGGQNFNPFWSPRTWGPRAQQQYWQNGISGTLGAAASMANSAGRGNCGCQ